ncbi:hypothetical protein BC938DRAFT_477009 [Jimgerdemannia flammicorona]|uniref:Uncharacterized protein n=1 Tax=Jimgerdemannia flammicorona TaxID=994334 RepID=A0A433QPW9_9FUNG|nr:hypothetical protein BC938DRAFT_477009 [Jimgerdemannia flammicorona]
MNKTSQLQAWKSQNESGLVLPGSTSPYAASTSVTVTWLFAHPTGWVPFDGESQAAIEALWDNGVTYGWVGGDSHFKREEVLVHLEQGGQFVGFLRDNSSWPSDETTKLGK